ncbi:alpha/beta fold hydrolase [Nocardia colli]|uniref:alpha/beta fold hydrolase n=1 Tax=Nocardia colli TaxID=2545717 RepID=UPI001CC7EFAB|nr:alpha/beta fold hydrolase [Nocardia colli]
MVLHGGLMTIDVAFGAILPALAAGRQVIAVELQGHGHTADIERDLTLDNLADDIAGLLDELGLERVDLFGFSLGGLTALRVAMRHPERVGRLVAAATHYRSAGYHPEIRSPQPGDSADRMPTQEDFQQWQDAYARVAPEPGRSWPSCPAPPTWVCCGVPICCCRWSKRFWRSRIDGQAGLTTRRCDW